MLGAGLVHAAPKKPAPVPLTAAGEKHLTEYSGMLKTLMAEVSSVLPKLDPALDSAFLAAHTDEGPRFGKVKAGSKEKPKQERDSGVYKDFKRQQASMAKARPILAKLDGFLGNDAIDKSLVKCAVIANATPRGLAAYAEQGPEHKARIDALLADHDLMKQMLVAGGAKAGRYGKAMEILGAIRAASTKSRDGILGRLALATALELAAPELCGYTTIDPVARYLSYEKWYLAKELDPLFEDMTTWECRHIINDDQPDEMLAWLRTMVRNYRPDTIATSYPRDKYMAINGDIPQTTPVYDEDIDRLQAVVCNGGRCGPKAALGRATTRAFGIPTWGARVKAHTGMTYWTPHGWTAALGVAFNGSFWDKDQPERMWSTVFRLDQMARENQDEYLKALRCGWIGDALGQEKINGMVSGTGGFWHALALNKKRAIVTDSLPDYQGGKLPWSEDAFALAKDYPKRPEENSPLVTPAIGPEDRRIEAGENGLITIPAAACVTPTASNAKILFMESDLGGIQLHYKRKGSPESFIYEVTVPTAGDYLLSAKVVTINRDQSLQLKLNDRDPVIDLPLPYTTGMWEDSKPVKVPLKQGKNTLSFTRRVPEEFSKHVWTRSGPEYGGVSIRSFALQPAAR
jgi:hypothetical protein